MSQVSFFKENKTPKFKKRTINYDLIYALKDKGLKHSQIKAELNISEGTFRHAMMIRKKAANG